MVGSKEHATRRFGGQDNDSGAPLTDSPTVF